MLCIFQWKRNTNIHSSICCATDFFASKQQNHNWKIIKSHVNSSGYVWNITIPSTDPAFAIIDSNWAVFEITAEIISTELLGLGLWESIFLIVCILCVN